MKKNNEINLSVIVPCYNEKENIPLIVNRFKQILPININAELILVDNGSKDKSSEVMNQFSKKYSFIRIVKIRKNIGYGNGVWSGIKEAKGEFICWTHADMQTDINDTVKAYKIIKKQNDPKKCFIKGNRKGRPFFDRLFTASMSIFETIVLGKTLYDINAQPNLFHKSFLKNIKDPPKDFSFDLYFYYILKKMKYKVVRFPVLFKVRLHGKSSWDTGLVSKWKFIKRTVDFTFKLKDRLRGNND